jgi:hypothetical protein
LHAADSHTVILFYFLTPHIKELLTSGHEKKAVVKIILLAIMIGLKINRGAEK